MAEKIKARPGDTWSSIAARELGNATLGDELAGANGFPGHTAVPEGAEIILPHRTPAATPADRRAALERELAELDAPPAAAAPAAAPPKDETVDDKRARLRAELNATYD